jgi:hypothetical protein
MEPRRAAVSFQSCSHRGIFIMESGLVNLAGGKIEFGESASHAAVREVEEEMGGWPGFVSRDVSTMPSFLVGVTLYYLVVLESAQFEDCVTFFEDHFPRRRRMDNEKITSCVVLDIGDVTGGSSASRFRSELIDLFLVLRANGHLIGPKCSYFSPRNRRDGASSNPLQTYSCWLCERYVSKEDHFWCSGDCGYEICRTCLKQGGPAVTLKCLWKKWHCDECSKKYWAGMCIYCQSSQSSLKQCAVCARDACRKDSYWCQGCGYNICRLCQEEGVVNVRRIRGRWLCATCYQRV